MTRKTNPHAGERLFNKLRQKAQQIGLQPTRLHWLKSLSHRRKVQLKREFKARPPGYSQILAQSLAALKARNRPPAEPLLAPLKTLVQQPLMAVVSPAEHDHWKDKVGLTLVPVKTLNQPRGPEAPELRMEIRRLTRIAAHPLAER